MVRDGDNGGSDVNTVVIMQGGRGGHDGADDGDEYGCGANDDVDDGNVYDNGYGDRLCNVL